MHPCRKCHDKELWGADTIRLLGGVYTHLCADCRTAWHSYLLGTPQWDAHVRLTSRGTYYDALAAAGEPPDEAAFVALALAMDALTQQVFALAQAWLAAPLETA